MALKPPKPPKPIGNLFTLGEVRITPGARAALNPTETLILVGRHVNGDWSEMCDEDQVANKAAAKRGLRVLSEYTAASGKKIWVVTEGDRKDTTILLPEEY